MGKVHFPLVNLRKDVTSRWHMKHIIDEEIIVPETANEYGYYTSFLTEVPDAGSSNQEVTTTAPVISGLIEFRGSPIDSKTLRMKMSPVQFYVNYQTGEILFHPNQAGNSFKVSYWGKGSLIECDDINFIHEKMARLEKEHDIPEFTKFEIKNLKSIYEVGEVFPSPSSPNDVIFEWETTFPDRVKPGSIQIVNLYSGNPIASGLDNIGSNVVQVQELFMFSNPETLKFKISAEAINGSVLEKELSLIWTDRIIWGFSPVKDITPDQLKTFGNSLMFNSTAENQKETIRFNETPQFYKVIATPKRYPITKIVDRKTSLDFIFDDPFELTIKNNFNLEIPYLVYVSTYQVSSAVDLIVTFEGVENGNK